MFVSFAIFGELLITEDTLVKVVYKQSRSPVAFAIQIVATVLLLCHIPLLLFTSREAILHFIVFMTKSDPPVREEEKEEAIEED